MKSSGSAKFITPSLPGSDCGGKCHVKPNINSGRIGTLQIARETKELLAIAFATLENFMFRTSLVLFVLATSALRKRRKARRQSPTLSIKSQQDRFLESRK